jgi:hypothetical protein
MILPELILEVAHVVIFLETAGAPTIQNVILGENDVFIRDKCGLIRHVKRRVLRLTFFRKTWCF